MLVVLQRFDAQGDFESIVYSDHVVPHAVDTEPDTDSKASGSTNNDQPQLAEQLSELQVWSL